MTRSRKAVQRSRDRGSGRVKVSRSSSRRASRKRLGQRTVQIVDGRCIWAARNPVFADYHDREWGVPTRDDRVLFEFLVLSGAQAGLSWGTVLNKRPAYRDAFAGFDPARVARFGAAELRALMANPGIIRNKQKIRSAIQNARATLGVKKEFGTFAAYLWQFVNNEPIVKRRRSVAEIPPRSAESDALSEDLKRRGFSFVGTTICYAFMQTVGMVNDHLRGCTRWFELPKGER